MHAQRLRVGQLLLHIPQVLIHHSDALILVIQIPGDRDLPLLLRLDLRRNLSVVGIGEGGEEVRVLIPLVPLHNGLIVLRTSRPRRLRLGVRHLSASLPLASASSPSPPPRLLLLRLLSFPLSASGGCSACAPACGASPSFE